MLKNKLMQSLSASKVESVADAIDFDGTNDYLSRSSDLVGNADGKTFTFSAWVYTTGTTHRIYDSSDSGTNSLGIYFLVNSGGVLVRAWNASGTSILFAQSSPLGVVIPIKTWTHILLSVDLTNISNRHFYINGVPQSITWTAYNNDVIDFTRGSHGIGSYPDGVGKSLERISNLYLDYTYLDLSIEANRRLFITADRKPAANQAALNPILYLPLSDPTQPGKNLGTGGDFALTGVVARSGRGPSQFNAPYSDLDGSADYLSRGSALVGAVAGKQCTISICFNFDAGTNVPIYVATTSTGTGRAVVVVIAADGQITVTNDSGYLMAYSPAGTCVFGRNYILTVSFDLSDTSKRQAYLNGSAISFTWATYTNNNINFAAQYQLIGGNVNIGFINGRLGNIFFDTKYIDLSVPSNLAKFVTDTGIDAKPVDLGANGELPFGTPPLIYLPMYGNNAGKNYGTGGDFTVNSGPYPGARGPNEYWGNKADFNGTTGYLARTSALTGVSDGKTFSCVFSLNADTVAVSRGLFEIGVGSTNNSFRLMIVQNGSTLQIYAKDTGGTIILNAQTDSVFSAGVNYSINLMIDLANIANRAIYVNNTPRSVTYTTYTNTQIPMSATSVFVGRDTQPYYFDGKLSEFYFTTDYIDFFQEANRLKFSDAFGNPVDLTPQIEAGTLPKPAIYMRFGPANFGKNSGTGGDFTVNGTITDGGQL